MAKSEKIASQISIQLDGEDLKSDIMQNLAGVVVDQHAHLPAMFTLRLYDPRLELVDGSAFELAAEVRIRAESPDGKQVTLIEGEITAIEPRFDEGMIAELVVRGFDRSHRLYRETKSEAFISTRDSEIAAKVAEKASLTPEVDETTIPYEHIFQANQSSLAFLRQRARRIGYECFVAEGKLYFRKPVPQGAGVTLTWGKDLHWFHPRMTLAEQVDEVIVKGWDADKQKPIIGRAAEGSLYPKIGDEKEGAAWAQEFGPGKKIVVDQPVISQTEADLLAAACLDEISGSFVTAEGLAYRRPDICAGQSVKLEALGKRFSGEYLVTAAQHEYGAEGLRTRFQVQGTRSGLLGETLTRGQGPQRWPSVVTAKVTNSDDPLGWGRVKVKFPWLADDAESDWARVLGIGAGPQAGFYTIPEVGDEVLVAFGHGDISQPYVLGGLWNGQAAPPPEGAAASAGEKPLVRTWRSRGGHHLTFYDDAKEKIEIESAGGRRITIDDRNKNILIETAGVQITLKDRQLTIESDADIQLKAGSGLKLEAQGNIDLQAGGQVNIKGATVNLN